MFGQFGKHLHLDGAEESLGSPEAQAGLQNVFGGRCAHAIRTLGKRTENDSTCLALALLARLAAEKSGCDQGDSGEQPGCGLGYRLKEAPDFSARKICGVNIEVRSSVCDALEEIRLSGSNASPKGGQVASSVRSCQCSIENSVVAAESYTEGEPNKTRSLRRNAGVPRRVHAAMDMGRCGGALEVGEIRLDPQSLSNRVDRNLRGAYARGRIRGILVEA